MGADTEVYIRSIVAMLMITSAWDPVKILFFNQVIESEGRNRHKAALQTMFYILAILGGAALIGRQLLDIMGINLNAFSVVGGLLIATMGLEMLKGGGASSAQGQDVRARDPGEQDSLLIPLTIPLIAGPGAITTTITIAAQDIPDGNPVVVALIGVGVVGVSAYVSFAVFGKAISKMRPQTAALLARLGGLLLATIGTQMTLGGLKNFFN